MAKRKGRPAAKAHPVEAVVATDVVAEVRAAADAALLVQPKAGASMSRLQRTFNGLVQQVAGLEQRLSVQRDELEVLLARYRERVAKRDRELADAQLALARALADAHARLPLRGNQKKDLAATLCALCEDAFLFLAPDAETEALYDAWSECSYREALSRASAEQDEGFDDEAEAGTGNDAEERTDDDDRPRGRRGGSEPDEESPRGPGQGADFAAREARRLEQAALTRRSVREVYLALARVLHPDTVTEASERQEREDAMKQATEAYRTLDFLALLRLELRWIRREGHRRDGMGDDTLRAYIRALRVQVAKLERAVAEQAADPRYDPIAFVAFLPKSRALKELEDRARQLRAVTADLVDLRGVVRGSASRQELAAIVRGARHHGAR